MDSYDNTHTVIAEAVYVALQKHIPKQDLEESKLECVLYDRRDYVSITMLSKGFGSRIFTQYRKRAGGSISLTIDFYDDRIDVYAVGHKKGADAQNLEYANPDSINEIIRIHKAWIAKIVTKPRRNRILRKERREAVKYLKEFFTQQAIEDAKKQKERRVKNRKAKKQ